MNLFFILLITIIFSGCTERSKIEKSFVKHGRKDMVLSAGGDFICAREFDKTVKEHGPDYPFIKAKEHLKKADITFANLECVVSDNAELRSKDPNKINYNAPSTVIPALKTSGFDVFSIANNHTFDLGSKGLADLRKHLKNANLMFGGAGKNAKDAEKPLIVKVNGLKIAFLFYNSTGSNFCAKKKRAGYNCMPLHKKKKSLKKLKRDLKKVKGTDLVFLSIHWGNNYKTEPVQEHIDFAHAAIDAGVDAILGHSSHIFQGVEVYKNRPILYDMGDVFLKKPDSWDTRSFFFDIIIENSKIKSLELLPIFMNDTQIRFAEGILANEMFSRFYKYSKRFGTKIRRNGNRITIKMDQEEKPMLKKAKIPLKVSPISLKNK